MMRRLSVALVAALVLAGMLASVAFAGGSPHFIKNATTASIDGSGALVVSFKEAGLPSGAVETVVLTADGSATYGCFNGGGNHPKAANKATVSGPLSASGTFAADQNGNIVGSLSVGPVPPGSFSCPSGQTLRLMAVSYTNVSLADTTSGATAAVPGTISKTFIAG